MTDDGDRHVTARELGLVIDTIREASKALESRLTVKILLATLVGTSIGKVIGPAAATAAAAVGVAGWWGCKILVAALLHR